MLDASYYEKADEIIAQYSCGEKNVRKSIRKKSAGFWYVVEPDVWQGDRIRFMHVLKKCRKVWIMSRLKSEKRLHIRE